MIGIDVGGTKTLLMIQRPNGNILAEEWIDSPRTPEGLKAFISSSIAQAGLTEEEISGLAIGVPGLVNADEGLVLDAPGLGWKNLRLKEKLFDGFSFPCRVENDITMAMIAEMHIGKACGVTDAVFIAIGTGLGCAILSNGRIVEGSAGSAGNRLLDERTGRGRGPGEPRRVFRSSGRNRVSGSALQKLPK